jgi:hypothetical protein
LFSINLLQAAQVLQITPSVSDKQTAALLQHQNCPAGHYKCTTCVSCKKTAAPQTLSCRTQKLFNQCELLDRPTCSCSSILLSHACSLLLWLLLPWLHNTLPLPQLLLLLYAAGATADQALGGVALLLLLLQWPAWGVKGGTGGSAAAAGAAAGVATAEVSSGCSVRDRHRQRRALGLML